MSQITPTVVQTGLPRPVNQLIRASKIKVDLYKKDAAGNADGYQRDADAKFAKLVKKMKSEFQADLYLPISVAEYQGEYFVFDGNCRRTLAVEAGLDPASAPVAMAYFQSLADEAGEILFNTDGTADPLVECRVTLDCDPIRQAWLFVALNENRRSVPWMIRHWANLTQKTEIAMDIERVVRGLGLTVDRGSRPGVISAVQALYSTMQFDGADGSPEKPYREELLQEVLDVANQSWSEGRLTAADRQYCFSDRTIDALSMVLDEFDAKEMPRDIAINQFKQVMIRHLILEATKKTSAHGSNNVSALAKEIARQYNKATAEYPDGFRLRISRLDTEKRRAAATRKRQAERAKLAKLMKKTKAAA